jgi:hypothetical protein
MSAAVAATLRSAYLVILFPFSLLEDWTYFLQKKSSIDILGIKRF